VRASPSVERETKTGFAPAEPRNSRCAKEAPASLAGATGPDGGTALAATALTFVGVPHQQMVAKV